MDTMHQSENMRFAKSISSPCPHSTSPVINISSCKAGYYYFTRILAKDMQRESFSYKYTSENIRVISPLSICPYVLPLQK